MRLAVRRYSGMAGASERSLHLIWKTDANANQKLARNSVQPIANVVPSQ